MKLKLLKEFGNTCLKEVGEPVRMWRFPDRKIVAVASSYNLNHSSERCAESGFFLQQRISLYDEHTAKPIGVMDKATFGINDVALHPSKPQALVAFGSYDGGYTCQGNVLLWDWQTGEARKLLTEDREVTNCRFEDNGNAVGILLHPACDGESGGDCSDVFFYIKLQMGKLFPLPSQVAQSGFRSDPRLAGLQAIQPKDMGFDRAKGQVQPQSFDCLKEISAWLRPLKLSFEARPPMSDIQWLDDTRVAVAHQKHLLEVWSTGGKRLLKGAEGQIGRQVLRCGADAKLVIVSQIEGGIPGSATKTYLHHLDGASLSLTKFLELEHDYSFRRGAAGWLLGVGQYSIAQFSPPALAYSIAPDLTAKKLAPESLRGLKRTVFFKDVSRHLFLSAPEPPSLQEAGSKSHSALPGILLYAKALLTGQRLTVDFPAFVPESVYEYLIEPSSRRKLWTLLRAGKDELPLAGGIGIEVEDSQGRGLVLWLRFCKTAPREQAAQSVAIERRNAETGAIIWRVGLSEYVLDLCWLAKPGIVIAALSTGELLILDTKEGCILFREFLKIDGAKSLALSLAAHEHKLAISTMEGRIAIFEVTD